MAAFRSRMGSGLRSPGQMPVIGESSAAAAALANILLEGTSDSLLMSNGTDKYLLSVLSSATALGSMSNASSLGDSDAILTGADTTASGALLKTTLINAARPTTLITNRYYLSSYAGIASANALSPTADTIYFIPFLFNRASINRIGVTVTTAVADSTCRLAVYSMASDGTPDSLILDAGTVSTAATGNVEATISLTGIGNGFIAVNTNAAIALRQATRRVLFQAGYAAFDSATSIDMYTLSSTYGAFPSSASGAAAVTNTNGPVLCWVRSV